jgi:putative membrane protein
MFKNMMFGGVAIIAAMLSACVASEKKEELNDMQIAHIAYTAGVIDISYANLALEITKNADVRAFAEIMLRDHAAINDAALALVEKLGGTPEDNATSQNLQSQAAEKRDELRVLKGVAFDKAYAANELAYHQFVNETVENTFMPAAQNEEFKALLGVALKTFQAHEGHAEKMAEGLN